MGRKAGISTDDVARVAATIADRDGLDATTLTAVAGNLGIKTPSLYNHVDGLAGLRRLLAIHGSKLLLEEFRSAKGSLEGREALRAISYADRDFAIRHPGLYSSFLPAPTPEEDEELYNSLAQPAFFVAQVLLDLGIPQSEAIHLIRAMRALLHGFLDLEAKHGFGMPIAIDVSFEIAVELILEGVEQTATRPKSTSGNP